MPDTQPVPITFERDGASRSRRRLPALAADSAAIEDDSLADRLAIADALARELAYYGLNDQPDGDWQGFLNPQGLSGSELAAHWQDLQRFASEPDSYGQDSSHRRPHLVLFLAFLRLLESSQRRLNQLAQQHLDFYYGSCLGLRSQAAQPDRVHLLAQLAQDAKPVLLPQGTLFDAGKDSQGKALVYRSDEDLLVNRTQVKCLYSVFVDKTTTGIREAREACVESQADPLLAMFALVYGDPANSGRLPSYPPGLEVDGALLDQLGPLLAFVDAGLFCEFQEFRKLMSLKNRRQQTAGADWQAINRVLALIGQAELKDPNFAIQPADSADFWANLKKALNGQAPDVKSVDSRFTLLEDLYWQRERQDVQNFVGGKLHLTMEQFCRMIELKIPVDQDWRIVNTLLEAAAQRRLQQPAYRLLPDDADHPYNHASTAFDANFAVALGSVSLAAFKPLFDSKDVGSDLDRYYAALLRLEQYFYCSWEDFSVLLQARAKDQQSDPKQKPAAAEWERVYAILAVVYANKVYGQRRGQLQALRQGKAQYAALEAMLRLAAGDRGLSAGAALERLAGYWPQDIVGDPVYRKLEAALKDTPPPVLTEDDWQAAVVELELAWRKREGKAPVAQTEEWLNLYTSRDASSIQRADLVGTPRWRTFGQRREAFPFGQPPEPLLGWVIASPLLCLAQGERTVSLTLLFQPGHYDQDAIAELLKDGATDPRRYPFQVEISSAKGWIEPAGVQMQDGNTINPPLPAALCLTLNFGISAPPLAALPDSISPWPILRLRLRSLWQGSADSGHYATPYPLFQSLVLERVLLQVRVAGLSDLLLYNDDGPLPAGKPFEPFGLQPAAGSRFSFAHPELAAKRLQDLTLNLPWMQVPAKDLGAHYANYPDPSSAAPPAAIIAGNASFTVAVSLVDSGLAISLQADASAGGKTAKPALFDAKDAGAASAIAISGLAASLDAQHYSYRAEQAPFQSDGLDGWPRYWRLELNSPDFQHSRYAAVAAAKSVALATAIANKGSTELKPADYQVNPPYTPKLKSFSVDYSAVVEIALDPGDVYAYGRGEERIYYQQAFGLAEIQPEPASGLYHLLPAYPNAGELYIGLENLDAPQDLSLLMQMAEGSANPDLPLPTVQWSYLSGNRWLSLDDGGILADASNGLAQSGILRLRLPQAEAGGLMPGDCYWLRAAVAQNCDAVCDTIAIYAQALAATWLGQDNAPEHLQQPLPANTIVQTAEPLAGLAAVLQPYSSFGGKAGEDAASFELRVSERLRHKQRAVDLWDYEHLILERFPAIYQAKCLPAAVGEPGKVQVIVIPDIHGRLPFNPFEPKATAGQIAEIQDFLQSQVPDLAEVVVRNAHYVPVRLRFAVRFMPGCDAGFYKMRLNDELNRFLSPWAYQDSNDVAIGGKLYANAIVDFLERRPYVDYVAGLKLFKNEDGLGFTWVADPGDGTGYRVQAECPDGVLVADRQHDIDLIEDASFHDEKFTGIGYMKVELDFIVE